LGSYLKPVQKPHPPIWVGGESWRAIRRAAQIGDAWCPIGTNSQFPLSQPEQLAAGMERLAVYARGEGRDPAEIEVVFRLNPVGQPEQIAGDIRRYEQMGVGQLVVSFGQTSGGPNEVLERMEQFATQVWPLV